MTPQEYAAVLAGSEPITFHAGVWCAAVKSLGLEPCSCGALRVQRLAMAAWRHYQASRPATQALADPPRFAFPSLSVLGDLWAGQDVVHVVHEGLAQVAHRGARADCPACANG